MTQNLTHFINSTDHLAITEADHLEHLNHLKKQHSNHSNTKKRSTYTAYVVGRERADDSNSDCHGVSCKSLATLVQYADDFTRKHECKYTVNIVSNTTGEILVSTRPDLYSCECYFDTLNHVSSFNPSKAPSYPEMLEEDIFLPTIEERLSRMASDTKAFGLSLPLIIPASTHGIRFFSRGRRWFISIFENINHWAWNNYLTSRVKGKFCCVHDGEALILAEHGWKVRKEKDAATLTHSVAGYPAKYPLWIVENL